MIEMFQEKKKRGKKIVSLTAYDFPTARILDEAKVDVILVGDSLGMVMLGYETTVPVTLKEMEHHTKATARAVKNALVVADMPYQSYKNISEARRNAKRLIKAGAQAVKLEGGAKVSKQVRALVKDGIPVMGHLGMLPQSVNQMGGYRVQGRTQAEAKKILEDALLLEKQGVFAIVLECVPHVLAKKVTKKVRCPTIGIGAGKDTDGQILVLHDMLGIEGSVRPRFVRQYARLDRSIKTAVSKYRKDVIDKKFPTKKESFA